MWDRNASVRPSRNYGGSNVQSSSRLDVHAGDTFVGVLARSQIEDEAYLFGYSDLCPAQHAVSISMPVVRDQYDSMGGLLPIFEMNLPEGALLERLRNQFAKLIPNFDSLDLLAIVGRSQIGRLRFATSGMPLATVPEHSINELLMYAGAEDLFSDLLRRYAEYSGISGVQPKVLLRAQQAPHRAATHIVKSFDPREYPELGANEYFCMRAAYHSGIPVPTVRLSDNRRILLVERFDFRADGTYLGCEDFCVLNGLRAHGRYTGSYERIAERIEQFVSLENHRSAYEQFFATVALCCVIGNGDAHLKNFSVLYENAQAPVSLAPAYDLVCTTLYEPRDILALTLGDSKAIPDRKRLRRFAQTACNLSAAKTGLLLERVIAGARRAIIDIRRYTTKNPGFAAAGAKLVAVFEAGAARLAGVDG
jgi:serine/threonine-protein kinase HipA